MAFSLIWEANLVWGGFQRWLGTSSLETLLGSIHCGPRCSKRLVLGAVAATLAGFRTQGLQERAKGVIRGDSGGPSLLSSCPAPVLLLVYIFLPFLSLSPPQPLATTLLHPVSMNLPVLGTSYKGNHAIFILLCLADFTEHHVQGSFVLYSLCQNFIPFFLGWKIFRVYITFCLSIHLLMGIWVISTFWLLWIMLLWTFVYKYLFQSLLSFFRVYT